MIIESINPVSGNDMIGRDKELAVLLDKINGFGKNETSVLLVEGEAGVGKTTIIQQALARIQNDSIFKIYGKCRNNTRVPYHSIKQALKDWTDQILVLSEIDFIRLKDNTVSALQAHIPIVTSVFDELEMFFGRKNLLTGNNANEQVELHQIQSRFYYFFTRFLEAIHLSGFRMIIYLDDLQWSDQASRLLIQHLMDTNRVPGLIIIVAYRPFEIIRSGKSLQLHEMIGKYEHRAYYTRLNQLDFQHLNNFLPADWSMNAAQEKSFQKYLWYETEGNPFKIGEIMRLITKERIFSDLKLNPEQFWNNLPHFDQEKNSVRFVVDQLKKLPGFRQQVISAASVVGFYFKPETVADLLNLPQNLIQSELESLAQDHFLINNDGRYFFIHDNIHGAATDLLAAREKATWHNQMGISGLEKIPDYQQNDFFQALNYLNYAHELHPYEQDELQRLLALNIQGAQLAIRSSAFERAYKYLRIAEKLQKQFPEGIKIRDPKLSFVLGRNEFSGNDLRFSIQFGMAETQFLRQEFMQALKQVDDILQTQISRHQKIKATFIKVRIASALTFEPDTKALLTSGLNSLMSVLADFQIVIPEDKSQGFEEVRKDVTKIQQLVKQFQDTTHFEEIINSDQEYQDLMSLIVNSLTFIYYMDVHKNLYVCIKSLLITLEKGLTPITPVLFSASFLITNFDAAYNSLSFQLGKFALKMIESHPFSRYTHVVYYVGTLNFYAWENHYSKCVEVLEKSVQLAIEAGEHHYVTFCSTNIRLINIYRGLNLQKHVHLSAQQEKENHHVFFISATDSALVDHLIGIKPGFEEGKFDFDPLLVEKSEYNMSSRYHMYLALEKLYFLSGHLEKALEAGEICEHLENVYHGFQIEVEHMFYYSLILMQLIHKFPETYSHHLPVIEEKLRELKRLAGYGSGNYRHKVLLIEAELARYRDDFEQASLFYDQAISEAVNQKFINNAAIATEMTAYFYLAKERIQLTNVYLKKAQKYYQKWGAEAKVQWLTTRYPQLIRKSKADKQKVVWSKDHVQIREILAKVADSKQFTTRELADYLITELVSLGRACLGLVLIKTENSWNLIATAPNREELIGLSLGETGNLIPTKVLNYALNKSQDLSLEDAWMLPLFGGDSYMQQFKPAYISCFPIMNDGHPVGLIYLEYKQKENYQKSEQFDIVLEQSRVILSNAIYNDSIRHLNHELQVQEQKRIDAIIDSQMKERKRIAEELHDSIGQMLALVKLNFSRLESGNSLDKENKELLIKTSELLDESCDEIRTISHNLMPPQLNQSLPDIIQRLVKKNLGNSGISFSMQSFDISEGISNSVKFTFYRIVQEIIHNIIKHAGAGNIQINLTQIDEGINLMVEDDGKGFDKNLVEMGLGLKNIHSRVKSLNGYFDVDSAINRGTIYNITIPLQINK